MKAAFKYFFYYMVLQVIGAILFILPGLIVSLIAGNPMRSYDDFSSDTWLMSVIFLGSELLPLFVFWKMKYASLDFKFAYDFGDLFSPTKLYLWAAVGSIGVLLFNLVTSEYVYPFDWDLDTGEFIGGISSNPIGVLCVCLFGPILEEVVFRGAILRRLLEKPWRPWVAILVSAIFFSVAHGNLTQGVTALVLGCFMGWVYYRTRNLWPCILIHVLNNTIATVLGWALAETPYAGTGGIPAAVQVITIVTGLILLGCAIRQIVKMTRNRILLPPPINLPPQPQSASEPVAPAE